MHDVDRSCHFLHHKEEVTQGGPLAMIFYVICILPLVRELRTAHLHIMQTWCADDAGAGGKFKALHEHMSNLLVRETLWGYFPDTTKRILSISPRNVYQVEAHFQGMVVRVVTRSPYLGGLICFQESYSSWLERRWRDGCTKYRCWPWWRAVTCRQLTLACKSSSSSSVISSSTSPCK